MTFSFDQSAINKLLRRHLEFRNIETIYYDMPDGSRGGGSDYGRKAVHSLMERIHGMNADIISVDDDTLIIIEIDPVHPIRFLASGRFDRYRQFEDEMLEGVNALGHNVTRVEYIYSPVNRDKRLFDQSELPSEFLHHVDRVSVMYLTGFNGDPIFTPVPVMVQS